MNNNNTNNNVQIIIIIIIMMIIITTIVLIVLDSKFVQSDWIELDTSGLKSYGPLGITVWIHQQPFACAYQLYKYSHAGLYNIYNIWLNI